MQEQLSRILLWFYSNSGKGLGGGRSCLYDSLRQVLVLKQANLLTTDHHLFDHTNYICVKIHILTLTLFLTAHQRRHSSVFIAIFCLSYLTSAQTKIEQTPKKLLTQIV